MAGIRRKGVGNRMENSKIKIVFIGTPEFGAVILEALCHANMAPVLVVTETDKPVGRKKIITPPPVKIVAEKHNISILQLETMSGGPTSFQIEGKPDLIAVASYGKILPKEILEIPKHGCLNVHPSLLPKYRGATPVQSAILNGDKETGVTIMLMDEQIDHGPIIAQRKITVGTNETYLQLHDRLAELGASLLIDTIPDWIGGKIKLTPQDEAHATYTKILTREDGEIDWRKSPQEIDRQIRALNPWPGVYTVQKKKRIKILKAMIENGKLLIKQVQPEGKKPISFEDFKRGYSDFRISETD